MKKLALFFIASISFSLAHAQVTTLSEDFDITCITTGQHYPLNWSEWNTIPPLTALAWNCTPLGGRWGTPGTQCNSYYGGTHHEDTAWLFTPPLDLSGYADSVYLRFDSRYDLPGARLQVLYRNSYGIPPDTAGGPPFIDIEERLSPVIGPDDSAGWVTHYVNLTSFKNIPLYVAFRYASTNTSGGAWTIDNVGLTPWGLGVNDMSKQNLGLTVIGTSTREQITFSCSSVQVGTYNVCLYDNIGRVVKRTSIHAGTATENHTISGLNLMPGMYFFKLSNATAYSTAKVVVE